MYRAFQKAPLIRFVVPFVLGILSYSYFPVLNGVEWILIGIGVLVLTYYFKQVSMAFGIAFFAVIMLLGNLRSAQPDRSVQWNNNRIYVGRVMEKKVGEYGGRLTIRLPDEYWRVLLKVGLEDSSRIGDFVSFTAEDYGLPPPNRFGFDYREYLLNHRIGSQSKATFLRKTGSDFGWDVLGDCLRNRAIKLMRSTALPERHHGIFMALFFGDKSALDDEVRARYTVVGLVHILAVSGLHLGFVYLLIGFTVRILPANWRFFKAVIIIATLFLFAGITGFSASVCRAATMFSFVAIGQALGRRAGTFNMVWASMLVLLTIEPLLLYDLGFQLSYSALLGIIAVPSFTRGVKNVFGKKLIDAMMVSVVAQLTTMPLILYHFGNFPTYFLLANLLVLPLVALIVYCGVTLLVLAPWITSDWVALPVTLGLDLMTWITESIGTLPKANLNEIWISGMTAWTVSGMIVSLLFWFRNRRVVYLYAIFICLLAPKKFESPKHKMVLLAGRTASLITCGERWDVFSDSLESIDTIGIKRSAVRQGVSVQFHQVSHWRVKAGNSHVLWSEVLFDPIPNVLIVTEANSVALRRSQKWKEVDRVVLHRSVPPWEVKKWISESENGTEIIVQAYEDIDVLK